MDPITHGIAGALIAKAFFAGPAPAQRTSVAAESQNSAPRAARTSYPPRVAALIITLGAIFPDVDIFFGPFSSSRVATLEYHRWVTHSLLCMPIFALGLAAAVRGWWHFRDGRRERPTSEKTLHTAAAADSAKPGILQLALWFAIGLASHIFLDTITSWGTMLWAPLSNHRANWDWVFIIDGTLTTLLLLPQVLAWVYSNAEKSAPRRLYAWAGFSAGAIFLQQFSSLLGIDFYFVALAGVIVTLAVLFFGPEFAGWGERITRAQWCRAGVAATVAYLLLCFGAQRLALARVEEFVRSEHLQAQRVGALPVPPSFAQWAGMVRTSAGVYQATFSIFDHATPRFEFFADRATPESLHTARDLREIQIFLWFARFPVVETRMEGGEHILMFADHRFVQRWASAPAPFEYWVVLDPLGRVVRHGWAQKLLLDEAAAKE